MTEPNDWVSMTCQDCGCSFDLYLPPTIDRTTLACAACGKTLSHVDDIATRGLRQSVSEAHASVIEESVDVSELCASVPIADLVAIQNMRNALRELVAEMYAEAGRTFGAERQVHYRAAISVEAILDRER